MHEAIDFVPPELEVIGAPAFTTPQPEVGSVAAETDAQEQFVPDFSPEVEAASPEVAEAAGEPFGVGIFDDQLQESTPTEASAAADDAIPTGTLMEASEDDDTLPAMAPGSLAPSMELSELEAAPRGFSDAPALAAGDFTVEPHPDVAGELDENQWNLQPESERLPATPTGEFTPSFDATPRRKRKEKSLVGEVAKILIANIIAFPILYGAILWGFKKDPLKLAQFLPATIVPPEFQSKQPQTRLSGDEQRLAQRPSDAPSEATPPEPNEPSDAHQLEAPRTEPPLAGKSDHIEAPGELELPPLEEPAKTPEDSSVPSLTDSPVPSSPALTPSEPTAPVVPATPDLPTTTKEPSAVPAPQPTPEPQPTPGESTKPFEDPLAEPSTPPATPETPPSTNILAPPAKSEVDKPVDPFGADAPFPEPPQPMAPEPVKPEEQLGPKSEKTYAVSDTATAMETVGEAAAALSAVRDSADAAELRQRRVAYYTALSQLAEKLTLLRADASDAAAARFGARAQLLGIVDTPAKLDELGRLAGFWFNAPTRSGAGIALAGVAGPTSQEGKYYRTEVKLLGSDLKLPLLSASKPEVKEGDTIVALGTIVEKPGENLHHYQGESESPLVWASLITAANE